MSKEISGIIFDDISSEEEREYTFPNGRTLKIENPLWLNVSSSGGHRVVDSEGYSYYVQPREGWFIKWKTKEGKEPFIR